MVVVVRGWGGGGGGEGVGVGRSITYLGHMLVDSVNDGQRTSSDLREHPVDIL